MTYPSVIPSSRSFDAGDFPVKAFRSQDGAEVRLLYGSKRVGMKLQLGYQNVPDATAKLFVEHFHEMQGTYQLFVLPTETRGGWTEDQKWIDAEAWGSRWRYSGPPQLSSVSPGVSTVQVELVAATV